MTKNSITFVNEYKPIGWYSDERKKLCENIVSWIPSYLLSSNLFQDKSITVDFLEGGVSSISCLIDCEDKKYVLKIQTSLRSRAGEALFLKKWDDIGVRTPMIFDHGTVFEKPYLLLDYIDGQVFSRKYSSEDLIKKEIFVLLGETLARMHSLVTEGYGNITEGRGQFKTMYEWYMSKDIQDEIEYAIKHSSLAGPSVIGCIEDFISYIDKEYVTTYCHNDFSVSNVFATEPLIVIDPTPIVHHPLFDVARSIVIMANLDINMTSSRQQFIDGYKKYHSIDESRLEAAILLQSLLKFSYWHRNGKTVPIQKLSSFLNLNSEKYVR